MKTCVVLNQWYMKLPVRHIDFQNKHKFEEKTEENRIPHMSK